MASAIERIFKILKKRKEPILTKYILCTLRFSQTLDISKAVEILGYKPIISLEEGINKYGKWWKENKENKSI